jgi:hypothetical protein
VVLPAQRRRPPAKVLRPGPDSREDNWSYGIVEEEKPKLQPLLKALRRLRQCGLTARMVAAVFHHRRVLPLM